MINNELRYKEKILSFKEKAAIESGINMSIYFLIISSIFLILCLISVLLIIVYIFINPDYSAGLFIFMASLMILSVFFLFLSDRDVISSKGLNEKLFIYFDFLYNYTEKNKKKIQIWMINRRINKYLHELEKNLKNVFLFNGSDFDIELIVNIRKFLIEDLSTQIKGGNKKLVLDLIEKIKQAHLSSESMNLIDCNKPEATLEHNTRINSLKDILEACRKNKANDGSKLKITTKIYKVITAPSFLIFLFIIIGFGLLYYMNKTEDFSRMSANISVIGLILAIAVFIVQSRKL